MKRFKATRINQYLWQSFSLHMVKKSLFIWIITYPCLNFAQPAFETYVTAPLPVFLVAGIDIDVYAYCTKEKLYTSYYGTLREHTSAAYTFFGQSYATQLKDNITDLAVNADYRVYVRTKDNHILIYEDGQIIGGLPVESSDFFTDYEHEVYSNLLIEGNWIACRFKYNINECSDMFYVSDIPAIQSQFNAMKPKSIAFDDRVSAVITGDNGNSIAWGYSNNTKVHKSPASYLPCTNIKDISIGRISFPLPDRGEYAQLYTVCENGNIAYLHRDMDDPFEAVEKNFSEEEWKIISAPSYGWGKAQKIFHVGLTHVYAYTDAVQNSILVFNALKKVVCRIDVPGQDKINDMYYSPSSALRGTMLIASGNKVYAFKTNEVSCESGISSTQDDVTAHAELSPNPSSGDLRIICSDANATIKNIRITDMEGRICFEANPKGTSSEVRLETALHPGMYIVQIYDQNHRTSSHKLIIY